MKPDETIAEVVRSILAPDVPDEDIEAVVTEIAQKFGSVKLPASGESAAIALKNPKTAALVFDRVWAASPLIPEDIAFRGNSERELRHLAQMWVLLAMTIEAKQDNSLVEPIKQIEERLQDEYARMIDGKIETFPELRSALSRGLAIALFERYGVEATPVLESAAERSREYARGDVATLVTVVSGVDVVSENELTWDQVRAFRADADARRALRRMMHWLDATMVGKPLSFIEDEVNVRFEEYQAATRKHGLRTVVGTLSAILDSGFLVSATAASGVVGAFTGGLGALITGTSLVVAKAAVHVSRQMLDLSEARAAAAGEIAFVVEAQKLGK